MKLCFQGLLLNVMEPWWDNPYPSLGISLLAKCSKTVEERETICLCVCFSICFMTELTYSLVVFLTLTLFNALDTKPGFLG